MACARRSFGLEKNKSVSTNLSGHRQKQGSHGKKREIQSRRIKNQAWEAENENLGEWVRVDP